MLTLWSKCNLCSFPSTLSICRRCTVWTRRMKMLQRWQWRAWTVTQWHRWRKSCWMLCTKGRLIPRDRRPQIWTLVRSWKKWTTYKYQITRRVITHSCTAMGDKEGIASKALWHIREALLTGVGILILKKHLVMCLKVPKTALHSLWIWSNYSRLSRRNLICCLEV